MNALHRDDIEAWATAREFNELVSDEQHIVTSELGSREAYERLRSSLVAARTELTRTRRSIQPEAGVIRDLHAVLRARSSQHRVGLLSRFLAAKVPAYQAAFGVLVVAFMLVLVRPEAERVDIVRTSIVQDTIVAAIDTFSRVALSAATIEEGDAADAVERTVAPSVRVKRAARTIALSTTRQSSPRSYSDSSTDHLLADRASGFVGLDNLPLVLQQRRGVTLSEDTSYRQFTFAVN